ncbi:MAG: hypothetical protein AB1499_06990 [Nitrospirota bacterium]
MISRHKEVLLREAVLIEDFMRLLMKRRNTGIKWTRAEKKQIKVHLKRMSLYVPMLIVFLLPGGAFLLPVLAEVLDRRKKKRPAKS